MRSLPLWLSRATSNWKAFPLSYSSDAPQKVPANPLAEIFSEEVKRRLLRHFPRDYHLEHRLNVLGASGPTPSDPYLAKALKWFRAEKAAWETYLETAYAIGLFENDGGRDLRRRLESPEYVQFGPAMDECAAAWYLAGPIGLSLSPRPRGAGSSVLEMRASHPGGQFNVEVKSPSRQIELLPGVIHTGSGDDSGALAGCLEQAAKQLPKGQPNILVLFPRFMLRVATNRRMILNAFYGQDTINIAINTLTGEPSGDPYVAFRPDGHLLRSRRSEGKPRHTRISAIVTVEEDIREIAMPSGRLEPIMCHDVLVAHNPHAENPVSRSIWGDRPQLVHERESIFWTDGRSLTGWEE